MSLKGKVFTEADAPRGMAHDRKAAWAAEQTERYKIVAHDGAIPVVAEELTERNLRRLSANARIAATELLQLPLEVRREVLAAFDERGQLRNQLAMV